MNGNVVVSGDAAPGAYIGAACWTGIGESMSGKDALLRDEIGLECAHSVGQRVSELTLVVVAGKAAPEDVLPSKYVLKRSTLRPLAFPQR